MKTLFYNAAVYCGTYHKYNCGSLAGEWVRLYDFNDADELLEYLKEMHKDESDPEFMFQDTDNFPDFICKGEPSWSDVKRCIEFVNHFWNDRYDEDIIQAAFEIDNLKELTPDEVECWLEEHYIGEVDNERLGKECVAQLDVPTQIYDYVDFEQYGKDIADEIYTESNGYWFKL